MPGIKYPRVDELMRRSTKVQAKKRQLEEAQSSFDELFYILNLRERADFNERRGFGRRA